MCSQAMTTMTRILAALISLVPALALAGGPTAPEGWDGSFEPVLSNGEPCCQSADLNGTGLIGGAFVFLSHDKQQFALFALSYTPPMKERWQLLEKHAIGELGTFKVTLLPPGEFKHGAIKACGRDSCATYAAASAKGPFKKAHAKPAS
jgi:hypothetical protein